MDKINARVLSLMTKLGKSKSEMARDIDVSPSIMSHITSGRNKVGLDVLQKISLAYPEVSTSWLLNGIGSMFQESDGLKLQQLEAELDILNAQITAIDSSITVLKRSISKTRDLLH